MVTGVCEDVIGTSEGREVVDGSPAAVYQDVTYGVIQKRCASNVNPTTDVHAVT